MVQPTLSQPAVLSGANQNSTINVRFGPATFYNAVHRGGVGDRVEVLEQRAGEDGYTWYRVRLQLMKEGWVRGDLVRFLNPPLEERSQLPDKTIVPAEVNAQRQNPSQFTTAQIDYFLEIALGDEFGDRGARIRKWQRPVRIKVHGSPSAVDLSTLNSMVQEIKQLTRLDISIATTNANLDVYFVPEAQFSRYEPNYRPRNLGFFWTWWDQYSIKRARVLISTTGLTPRERTHLIREELTQSLGLMVDSTRYPDSIFYQGWSATTQYSDFDRAALALLYQPDITPGMKLADVRAILANSPR